MSEHCGCIINSNTGVYRIDRSACRWSEPPVCAACGHTLEAHSSLNNGHCLVFCGCLYFHWTGGCGFEIIAPIADDTGEESQ